MELHEYVDERKGRMAELASKIGAQAQLVWQWARHVRPVPIERCVPIERATEGRVRRWNLRPHDWHEIWPELVDAPGAPSVAVWKDAA